MASKVVNSKTTDTENSILMGELVKIWTLNAQERAADQERYANTMSNNLVALEASVQANSMDAYQKSIADAPLDPLLQADAAGYANVASLTEQKQGISAENSAK